MMNKEMKKKQVSSLSENFSKSKGTFLVSCMGLNVERMTELRKELKGNKSEIKVVRNTLARLSLEDHSGLKPLLYDHLKGTNAFVLVFGEDVSGVAKIIDRLSEEEEVFQIKCGILDGLALTPGEIKALADLPSKEILQSQFLGVLNALPGKFLRTLQAVPEGMVRVLDSYKETKK